MTFTALSRRALLCAVVPLLGAPAFAAEPWPAKTIKLVVPFPPGGPTDTATRILGQELATRLTQTVVVENKAVQDRMLASGAIAAYLPAPKLAQRLKSDYDKWGKVIRDKGLAEQ